MWDKTASRQHTLTKVFGESLNVAGDEFELIILGSVDLVFKTGESKSMDWAGHACLKRDTQKGFRFTYYRVYLQT